MPKEQDTKLSPGIIRRVLVLTAEEEQEAETRAAYGFTALADMTPTQAEAWVEAQVTDLTSAKLVLKVLARAIVSLAQNTIEPNV